MDVDRLLHVPLGVLTPTQRLQLRGHRVRLLLEIAAGDLDDRDLQHAAERVVAIDDLLGVQPVADLLLDDRPPAPPPPTPPRTRDPITNALMRNGGQSDARGRTTFRCAAYFGCGQRDGEAEYDPGTGRWRCVCGCGFNGPAAELAGRLGIAGDPPTPPDAPRPSTPPQRRDGTNPRHSPFEYRAGKVVR